MLAGSFLSRKVWEGKLRRVGAVPLEGRTALNTAEWWRIPNKAPFVVPVEDDGTSEFWAITKLCQQLEGPMKFKGLDDED